MAFHVTISCNQMSVCLGIMDSFNEGDACMGLCFWDGYELVMPLHIATHRSYNYMFTLNLFIVISI